MAAQGRATQAYLTELNKLKTNGDHGRYRSGLELALQMTEQPSRLDEARERWLSRGYKERKSIFEAASSLYYKPPPAHSTTLADARVRLPDVLSGETTL